MEKEDANSHAGRKWIKRAGIAGFLFFSIKGLLWIIVPAALVWWGVV